MNWVWGQALAKLDLTWCPGCVNQEHEGTLVGRTVHWRDRRVTRAGMYKMLRRIAVQQNTILSRFPPWQRTYLINQDVLAMAREIGVRLPREVFEVDRAKLRHELSGFTVRDRQRWLPSERYDYKRAVRWAARS